MRRLVRRWLERQSHHSHQLHHHQIADQDEMFLDQRQE
jgi:hypothetical protein